MERKYRPWYQTFAGGRREKAECLEPGLEPGHMTPTFHLILKAGESSL